MDITKYFSKSPLDFKVTRVNCIEVILVFLATVSSLSFLHNLSYLVLGRMFFLLEAYPTLVRLYGVKLVTIVPVSALIKVFG